MSKLKNSIKRSKKGNNSYIVSRIVTKFAQQIDIVVLNDVGSLGFFISALVFDLFEKNGMFHVFDSANIPDTIYDLDTN